jgi:hypothetical protein
MKVQNKDQIVRLDGNECFVEVLSGMLQGDKSKGYEGRVLINFAKYDKKNGNKMVCQIPIFVPVTEFLVLAKKVEFGKIDKLVAAEKARVDSGASKYPQAVWQTLGGTKNISPDGKDLSESRVMSISAATRSKSASIMLSAKRGPGQCDEHGLISPKFSYSPRNFEEVMVPVSSDALLGAVLLTVSHIQGMITAGWMAGAYQYKPGERPNSKQPASPAEEEVPYDNGIVRTPDGNDVTDEAGNVKVYEEYDDMPFS